MFTSTVMTKQPEDRSRARKVDDSLDTVIAETLPLDLASVYTSVSEKPSANNGNMFLNFQSARKHRLRSARVDDNIESSQTKTLDSSTRVPIETSSSRVTPSVVYVDEEEEVSVSNTVEEETDKDAVHILTDGFILPGALHPTPSSSISIAEHTELNYDRNTISITTTEEESTTADNLISLLNRINSELSSSNRENSYFDTTFSPTEMVLETARRHHLIQMEKLLLKIVNYHPLWRRGKTILLDGNIKPSAESLISELDKAVNEPSEILTVRSGKALDFALHSTEKPNAEEILPSISFPITYYTTSTYFTTFLSEGNTIVSSRKETISHVYTDSEQLKLAKLNPTETIIMPQTINPTKSIDPSDAFTTFTYFTTYYKDGSKVVSSRVETKTDIFDETSTSVPELESSLTVLTYLPYDLLYHSNLFYYPCSRWFNKSYGTTSVSTTYNTVSNVLYGSESIESTPTAPVHEKSTVNNFEGNSKLATYFTTYTYYTTYLRDGNPVVSTPALILLVVMEIQTISRQEEIVSRTVTLGGNIEPATIVHAITLCCLQTKEEVHSTTATTKTYYTTYTFFTVPFKREIVSSATVKHELNAVNNVQPTSTKPCCLHATQYPYTFYTTYTYYTTRFHGDRPIINTRYETLTNVIKAPIENSATLITLSEDNIKFSITDIKLHSETNPIISIKSTASSDIHASPVSDYEPASPRDKTTETIKLHRVYDEANLSIPDFDSALKVKLLNEIDSNPSPPYFRNQYGLQNKKETESYTQSTPNETTTVVEIPKRGIFSRRRNRPTYRPRPSFRSSTSSTLSPPTKASQRTTTTRGPLSFNRRNSTRPLYRRPNSAPRPNPLQRLRPNRPSLTPATSNDEASTNKRRRRSANKFRLHVENKPIIRKLLSSNDEEAFYSISKNNDLNGGNSSPEKHNDRNQEHQLGLIRTMESRAINNGVTTIYGTEIHGTFINGIYAQVAQTKVRIHTDTSNEIDKTPIVATPSLSSVSETNRVAQTTSNVIQPTSTTQNPYPTGLISSATRLEDNYGTVTLWTTQVYGTFVNNYYAHIASTHSNVFVNSKSSEVVPQPSTYYNNLFTESLQQVKPPTPTARSIDNSKTYKTGLLSSIVSEEEHEGTTTQYVTNIFGTYIGEQYAKHAKTSSKIIAPTSTESSLRSVGLISTIVNSVVNQNIVTLFKTEIIGTYLGQHYAQLARTSTEYKFLTTETPKPTSTEPARQKLDFYHLV
ncbi:transposable element Tc3 transposase [Caerostris extrusa]|uniref:Transposable element Tc3 transposase n=1 Tax=Caerostris extrusa TaxID=172846 RepID=A0AAV4S6R6_CAEEX|nr:transposable element Tc3 transposase [Caerostris extrusa]